jgi:hypothetical protein
MSGGTETEVMVLPPCQFHSYGDPPLAAYDGKTIHGPWAYMCEGCFKMFGVGLGTGRGQRLVLSAE